MVPNEERRNDRKQTSTRIWALASFSLKPMSVNEVKFGMFVKISAKAGDSLNLNLPATQIGITKLE